MVSGRYYEAYVGMNNENSQHQNGMRYDVRATHTVNAYKPSSNAADTWLGDAPDGDGDGTTSRIDAELRKRRPRTDLRLPLRLTYSTLVLLFIPSKCVFYFLPIMYN